MRYQTEATAHELVVAADEVSFLFVQNLDSSNAIYLHFNSVAVTAFAITLPDVLIIPAGTSWFGTFQKLTVAGLNVRTASTTVVCNVAAIIDTTP